MSDATYTDEMLTSFLDGELSATEADALATALENDAALADRLSALEIPSAELAA